MNSEEAAYKDIKQIVAKLLSPNPSVSDVRVMGCVQAFPSRGV
jgi:hypothetical protein